MKDLIDTLTFAVKNWWVSLLLGLLYILIAICLMFTPVATYIALSVLFSIAMFVSGTLEILFAISNKKNISSWGWYLAGGIIDLILGIYLMANVGLSMAVLPFIVAFWLMFRGFASTGYAMDLKGYGSRNWGWYMVFGILAILCSFGIIWQPGLGALSLVYMMAYITYNRCISCNALFRIKELAQTPEKRRKQRISVHKNGKRAIPYSSLTELWYRSFLH